MKFYHFLLSSFVCLALSPSWAQNASVPETEAKQAFIKDFDTGTVLYDKNADEKMPTSSMSKVMTSIIAYDALRDGKLKKEQELQVSERAWKMGGSRMFLDLNSMVKVEDLLKGVVIQSGNDACVALAEGVAGSEENFVGLMNRKAQDIGMESTNFMNASGWPDPNHYSTARDLATMGAYLIKEYPDFYALNSQKEFVYNNIKQGNRNPLLYQNIGADGVKTGHTEEGGYGLIGSAVANGRRVVMVINGTSSMQARADEAEKLMKWALTSFENKDIVKKDAVVATAPVVLGSVRTVDMAPTEGLRMTVRRGDKTPVVMEARYQQPLKAPIKAGDKIGTLTIKQEGNAPRIIDLLAVQAVDEAPFFKRMAEKFMILIVGTPKFQ